jgi:hypothetical protein
MNTDKKNEVQPSFWEGTSGCVTTESQLQSRLMMESVALQLENMTHKAKKSLKPISSPSSGCKTNFFDETDGFLNVLSDEMQSTRTRMPRERDELLLFLGDELEASTCGRTQIMYDFEDDEDSGKNASSRQRLIPIKEGGAVEEMLESIELGYEASLIGCGLAQ